ncbi:phosphatidylethanolamine N-methyltransferase family protein [Aestuariivivens sediminis]|uniref:phosphatidylethanolamine N-methyltransferase family protein n=1 Tax=Aestuariivivens sediminis TaxID=2913557 RepID=UPI001F56D16F|nr:phosphatidylethanolamine N-methyltransferase family protein [Aestuariivivens sediminis]
MKLLKYQHWHIFFLAVLLILLYEYTQNNPSVLQGQHWGIDTSQWLLWSTLVPIIHQLYVWLCWRLELYDRRISKTFGQHAFTVYKIGFAILILLRPISIILLAVANKNTIAVSTPISYILSGLLLIPATYLFYSVYTYFGIDRAFGIDHFQPDVYGNKPFVKQGLFKYTDNGMYSFRFLIFYIPGILLKSEAGLVLALFSHLYIWVHYFCTERPDIKVIYQKDSSSNSK